MRLPLRPWRSTLNSLGYSTKKSSSRMRRSSNENHYRRNCRLEMLEPRAMLTTNWVVTTLSDASVHTGLSLRDALADAAASSGDDVITFDSSLFTSGTSISPCRAPSRSAIRQPRNKEISASKAQA